MRPLIYDVAVSLDGYISGPGGDVSAFRFQGPHVEAYQARLAGYGSVVMGRATYEFGYAFGLAPGARAYPHMDHHIVSRRITLPDDADVEVVREGMLEHITMLKRREGGPIYLCGGGDLAGQLARAGLVDAVMLKLNPIVLGGGVPLFGAEGVSSLALSLRSSQRYDNGVVELCYDVESRHTASSAQPTDTP